MPIRVSVVIFTAMFFLLQGCVAIQPFPSVARSGDTISLALGTVDGLNKNNIHLNYYPSSTGQPVDITSSIRTVLKIYPDKLSTTWLIAGDATPWITGFSGHGAWLNIAIVDLPTLPPGAGYFQATFDSSVILPNSAAIQSANGVHINAEILPGTGSVDSFNYLSAPGGSSTVGKLGHLKPMSSVVLRYAGTNFNSSGIYPAAAEYKIKLPLTGDIQSLDDSSFYVVWDDKPGEANKQIQLNWKRVDDVITVNILVPTNPTLSVNDTLFRFSIVVYDNMNEVNVLDTAGTPQLLSYRFFNQNGNEITTQAVPELVLMQ